MNNICITGRITHDPELKQTPSGTHVVSFDVAVKRPHVKDVTDFIPCVAWRNTAEFISKYFKVGNMIAISGVMTTRKYEDKNKNKRTAYEVIVESADFCGGSAANKQEEQNEAQYGSNIDPQFEDVSGEDGLPF